MHWESLNEDLQEHSSEYFLNGASLALTKDKQPTELFKTFYLLFRTKEFLCCYCCITQHIWCFIYDCSCRFWRSYLFCCILQELTGITHCSSYWLWRFFGLWCWSGSCLIGAFVWACTESRVTIVAAKIIPKTIGIIKISVMIILFIFSPEHQTTPNLICFHVNKMKVKHILLCMSKIRIMYMYVHAITKT